MGAQRTSFEKLQRDRAKKAKAALKRERRQSSSKEQDDAPQEQAPVSSGGELSAAELLREIELVHKQLEDETITFEEFEERKADLMARLPID